MNVVKREVPVNGRVAIVIFTVSDELKRIPELCAWYIEQHVTRKVAELVNSTENKSHA